MLFETMDHRGKEQESTTTSAAWSISPVIARPMKSSGSSPWERSSAAAVVGFFAYTAVT